MLSFSVCATDSPKAIESPLLSKGGNEIFNVCNDLSACAQENGKCNDCTSVDSRELKKEKGPSTCCMQELSLWLQLQTSDHVTCRYSY